MQAVVEEILALPYSSQPDARAPTEQPPGWSALHLTLDGATRSPAAAEARLRLAARLIEARASVEDRNGLREATALHFAIGTGNLAGVQWLLGRADGLALVNTPNALQQNPLDLSKSNARI